MNKMKETELNGLCIKKEFKGNYDLFVKWFMLRFPNELCESYVNEWIDRWMSGTPTSYMDNESLALYIKVISGDKE